MFKVYQVSQYTSNTSIFCMYYLSGNFLNISREACCGLNTDLSYIASNYSLICCYMWIPLQIIKVTLSDVDLEYSIGCVHDAITFYDGSEIVDDVIATVCGNHDNVVKYSRSSTVSFYFLSK